MSCTIRECQKSPKAHFSYTFWQFIWDQHVPDLMFVLVDKSPNDQDDDN